MIAINAHYDGDVIVPDEPVDLTPNQPLIVRIELIGAQEPPSEVSALEWIADNASTGGGLSSDLSQQHDHYLYGVSKKPT